MRIDILLVEKGLASSRTRAQELIASGRVFMNAPGGKRQAIKKASAQFEFDQASFLEIEASVDAEEFVSRGGVKLRGALERTGVDVKNLMALDIGISTGGFTDCLLKRGASRVVGVDVGHGQLVASLRHDPRVRLFEGVNARELSHTPILEANAGRKFDFIVIDVSFISLTHVLPEASAVLSDFGSLIALVKPQFEVGREGLGKNGIVKNTDLYVGVEEKIRRACAAAGLRVEDYFASSIEGSDGNREFFVYAKPPQLALSGFGDLSS